MNEQITAITAEEAKKRILQDPGFDFKGATIKGNLDLNGATIEGYLDLKGATIEGYLNLSTKEGPGRIFVDSKQAQLVHWAAPTVPLVLV